MGEHQEGKGRRRLRLAAPLVVIAASGIATGCAGPSAHVVHGSATVNPVTPSSTSPVVGVVTVTTPAPPTTGHPVLGVTPITRQVP